jgi:hypothetical protein
MNPKYRSIYHQMLLYGIQGLNLQDLLAFWRGFDVYAAELEWLAQYEVRSKQ